MWRKQLANTRCGLMILPLLSYVTEQLKARIDMATVCQLVQIRQFFSVGV